MGSGPYYARHSGTLCPCCEMKQRKDPKNARTEHFLNQKASEYCPPRTQILPVYSPLTVPRPAALWLLST